MGNELTITSLQAEPSGERQSAIIGGELHRSGQPLDQSPAAVYLAGLQSELSRSTMRGCLNTIAALAMPGSDALSFPWAALRFQHTVAIRSKLADQFGAATANKYLAALRGALKAAWRLGQIDAEDFRRAADLAAFKVETLPAGRSLSSGELYGLLDACGQDALGVRDAAIIGLLYSCGLRRAELAKLDLSDFDPDAGTLRVQGKRNKERLAPVVNGALDALSDWLNVRGNEPGPLFLSIRRGGHIQHKRLTAQSIYDLLQARAAQAGIKELSPHDFRRTFVGDLLDAGADIVTVQKLAGHANVTTTARYDRRPEEAKRKAAQLLHVPYRKRTLEGGAK